MTDLCGFNNASIIWTNEENARFTRVNAFDEDARMNFKVITFKKVYKFSEKVSKIKFDIFADTRYFMWINGKFAGRGPVCAGGDYGMREPMDTHYSSCYEIPADSDTLEFIVKVRLGSVVLADTSTGRGCFVLGGKAYLKDGREEDIITDESWLCCVDSTYPEANVYDYTKGADTFEKVVCITDDKRTIAKSEIPLLHEDKLPAPGFEPIEVRAGRTVVLKLEYDKIYSAFLYLDAEGDTDYSIDITTYEYLPENDVVIDRPLTEKIKAHGKLCHMGQVMRSVGTMQINLVNKGTKSVVIQDAGIYYSHYPTDGDNGYFRCSDASLNNIWELCRHTLEICRQSLHLDSPLHQENLGCAGDYYIESLMSYYCFADTRLSRFDIVRIGDCLIKNNGTAFHTTYSFIWVQMLYDYYMYTGDISVVHRVSEALKTLLDAACSWTDANGLIDTPPNFMFVDWTISDDGFSRHHPPKSMGQSVMNAFYFNALCRAAELFDYAGIDNTCSAEAKRVKAAFNKFFYNEERGLYTDGLTTPTPKELISTFMPENKDEISYTMYPNILACLYGICPEEKAAELLERTLYKENLQPIQMYFMHFALEALGKTGLFPKYGLDEIRRWEAVCNECPKGLKEGWIQLYYHFDYSHAWGGTPMYQLPSKISGLEILEPGMKKIRLNPDLCGLENAQIIIPSPYGAIKIDISDEVSVLIPEEIELEM